MERKIRVGIVGLGRAGRMMQYGELMANPNMFEIVAGCDNSPDRLKDLPEGFAQAKLYDKYEDMLKDPNVEMIAIATRHRAHAPMAIQAAEAGKYVSVDKPYAINYAEMERLAAAAAKYPGKIFLRHNRRFEPQFMKAMKLMESGVLGEVNMIKLYRCVGYCRRNDWMTMTSEAGGLLTNWGPHLIDQMLEYLGAPVVDCWSSVRSIISVGDGDDHIKVIFKAANGRIGDLEISGATMRAGREIEIVGSRGTLTQNPGENKIEMRFVDPDIEFKALKPHPENPPFQYGNFDETLTFVNQQVDIPAAVNGEIWRHIYANIVNGVPYPISIERGLEVVKLTDLIFTKAGLTPPV